MKDICDKNMTFHDCELAILRAAVDKAEEQQGRKTANSPEIKRIIGIVENFLSFAQSGEFSATLVTLAPR